MRLRYEIECIGYVGLFRPRTPDSRTTFRLPAGGRGDVIVALEPVQWANNFDSFPMGSDPDCTVTLWLELGVGSKLVC